MNTKNESFIALCEKHRVSTETVPRKKGGRDIERFRLSIPLAECLGRESGGVSILGRHANVYSILVLVLRTALRGEGEFYVTRIFGSLENRKNFFRDASKHMVGELTSDDTGLYLANAGNTTEPNQ
jgi:hypothetical protein